MGDDTHGAPRHPAIENLLRHFQYGHLSAHLQPVSRPFCELAIDMASRSTGPEETIVGLRKLLEAKDCFVRAALFESME